MLKEEELWLERGFDWEVGMAGMVVCRQCGAMVRGIGPDPINGTPYWQRHVESHV